MKTQPRPARGAAIKVPFRLLPWLGLLIASIMTAAADDQSGPDRPVVSIIIDDMGNHARQGDAAISLPGALTFAFLPHTPHARRLAERAHNEGKEIMLHLPMDSHDQGELGPGALRLHMTESKFKQTLEQAISSVPYLAGLNNHMGSLLTRHPGAMGWLMEVLGEENLYFIDSRTSNQTVAQQLAQEYGIPNTRRNVFLDNVRDPEAIRGQFRRLLNMARKQGSAVGIGHPYPETLAVLSSELVRMEASDIRLITASDMIAFQRRNPPWQEWESSIRLRT